MAEFIENKFWMVLPYELVKHFVEIMFSPAAIKEERDRKPQFLCDHSWDWGWPSVNDSTLEHSPHKAMQCRKRKRFLQKFSWDLSRQ